jgi:hypothetical protein
MEGKEMNSEQAIISSLILTQVDRKKSMMVDRMLKEDFDEIRKTPPIIDAALTAKFISFLSDLGAKDCITLSMKHFREHELNSGVLEAKNLLVLSSKLGIDKQEELIYEGDLPLVTMMIEKGLEKVLRKKLKIAILFCLLTNSLKENFITLMSESTEFMGVPQEVIELCRLAGSDCILDIEEKKESVVPKSERNKEEEED